jgi:hypothetical protein
MKDFSRERNKIQFRIDDDIFECRSALAADVLLDFTVKFGSVKEDDPGTESRAILLDVLEEVLQPPSFSRFRQRMADRNNPIELPQVNQIIEWVFEEYGLRPTQPSDTLSPGQSSPGSGMSSTESAQDVVSISSGSPPISS